MRPSRFAAVLLALALLLVAGGPAFATGTVSTTVTSYPGGLTKYVIAWTSSNPGGAVSGNAVTIKQGDILQIKIAPNTGATQPTDLYDMTIVDADGLDVLTSGGVSQGSNLSNATPLLIVFSPPIRPTDTNQTLDVSITNAGAAKTGTVTIWVR